MIGKMLALLLISLKNTSTKYFSGRNDKRMLCAGRVHVSYPLQIAAIVLLLSRITAGFTGRADFILTFREGPDVRKIASDLKQQYKVSIKYVSELHGVASVRIPYGMSSGAVSDLLAADHRILSVESDEIIRITSVFPGDSLFYEQWALYNPSANRADIKAPEAWMASHGKETLILAIVDTGIDYFHPDLADNIWVNTGEIPGNSRDDDGNGYEDDVHGWNFAGRTGDPIDRNLHGTMMAGIVGAVSGNHIGICGIMHEVSMMAINGLGDKGRGYSSDLIEAIYYAVDNGAAVINASWGGGTGQIAMRNAIAYAASQNVLFVAAAGNNGTDNDKTPFYPASYDLDNIISVAATDRNDNAASFSCFGKKSVDLAAPGVFVISTMPGGGYQAMTGTSLSAPHVTACAGLLMSYAPGLSYREYVSFITGTVQPLNSLINKCASEGRLDLQAALKKSVGSRMDVKAAIYMNGRGKK